MKKIILTSMFIFSLSVKAQIPNAGFENWTSAGTYLNPDNWDNLNAMTDPMSVYTCVQGSPGNPGSFYLKLISKNVTMMGVMPGVAVSGVIDMATYKPKSGFAYNMRPQSLTGNWMYMAATNDSGYVSVYLTKWNTSMNMRDTVAAAMYNLPGMVMSWTQFTINLTYLSGAFPDTAMITLSASGPTPQISSYLYVDNLAFSGSVAGIHENPEHAQVNVYPNPASEKLILSLDKNKYRVDIYSLLGNRIKTVGEVFNSTAIDISELQKGEYIIKLISAEEIITRKFLKQ